MRVASLFSGAGGLDLAVAEALGAETVLVADVCKVNKDGTVGHHDPHRSPCSILAHRFPGVPNLGDVSLIDWAPWRGLIDIICPGSPLTVEFLRGRMRFHRPDWTPGPKGDRPRFGCALLIWQEAT